MLLVGAVDIALGWAWHTAYRARHHWTLKREGALAAAALVALMGAVETMRSFKTVGVGTSTLVEPALRLTAEASPSATESQPAVTADATAPVAVAAQPEEIMPADDAVQTVAAVSSPAAVEAQDPIGAKIMERLGDDTATGSVETTPGAVAAAASKPARVKPTKPTKRKVGGAD
jgi:hypothetical protein